MQMTGIGYCAIRKCDRRATEVVAGIALCRQDRELLEHGLKTPPKLFREVVYYVTWPGADYLKIGTSSAIIPRLRALSSTARGRACMLVGEPGSFSVERKRHREFKMSRRLGTELFQLSPQITEHIDRLRSAWPTWAELAGVGPEWQGGQ